MAHVNSKPADKRLSPLVVRLEPAELEALKNWARHEDRSLAAQTRIAMRGVIPSEFY
jgi:hypothetical protein